MIHWHRDDKPAWCPGCGDFTILRLLDEAIEQAGVPRQELVLVSGIGQAGKLPHYTRANVFNGLHGRALPAATGIRLANHRLHVVVVTGDGDMYGEGGNHLLHAMRRNIGIKAFVCDNQVYGLTKGQASPTSEVGAPHKLGAHGVIAQPINPMAMAIVSDCAMAARCFCGLGDQTRQVMVEALKCEGFALVDILQHCPTFNKVNTFAWYKDRARPIDPGHDPYDREAAMRLAMQWGDVIPTGILYRSRRASYESQIAQIADKTLLEQSGG